MKNDYATEFENLKPKPCEKIEIKELEINYIKEGNMQNLIANLTDWKTTIPAIISGASWLISTIWGIQLPQTEINTACICIVGLLVNSKK
jgi:hypothetical protein